MLQRQHTRARLPAVNVGCLTLLRLSITRRANASTRGGLQSFQPVQQSLNAGWLPFATSRGWYLSRAQLACDGIDGDEASILNLSNVEANASARTSATCFFACPLLTLAPVPHASRPWRFSIRTTVV